LRIRQNVLFRSILQLRSIYHMSRYVPSAKPMRDSVPGGRDGSGPENAINCISKTFIWVWGMFCHLIW
jgi:hypothetical protein